MMEMDVHVSWCTFTVRSFCDTEVRVHPHVRHVFAEVRVRPRVQHVFATRRSASVCTCSTFLQRGHPHLSAHVLLCCPLTPPPSIRGTTLLFVSRDPAVLAHLWANNNPPSRYTTDNMVDLPPSTSHYPRIPPRFHMQWYVIRYPQTSTNTVANFRFPPLQHHDSLYSV